MEDKPWRDRVLLEEVLLQQLSVQSSEAAKRRATALLEGVAQLGSVYAVAKDLGKSQTAISNAIKRHAPPASGASTTE
jgi:molybdenum-dependent DNA-binding transcriptional regulator ModE